MHFWTQSSCSWTSVRWPADTIGTVVEADAERTLIEIKDDRGHALDFIAPLVWRSNSHPTPGFVGQALVSRDSSCAAELRTAYCVTFGLGSRFVPLSVEIRPRTRASISCTLAGDSPARSP